MAGPTGWSVRSVSLAWHLCHQFWCWPDQRFGCGHATVGIACLASALDPIAAEILQRNETTRCAKADSKSHGRSSSELIPRNRPVLNFDASFPIQFDAVRGLLCQILFEERRQFAEVLLRLGRTGIARVLRM